MTAATIMNRGTDMGGEDGGMYNSSVDSDAEG